MTDRENSLETNKLTKEILETYVETNVDYYEKYRDKFKLNNNFISWNWSFFFFIPWLAYRKIWGLYFGFVVISTVLATFAYKLITAPHDLPPVLMIITGLVILHFTIFSFLSANNQVLKRARENGDTRGRSSLLIVFLATLLLMLPNIVALAMIYPLYKKDIDRDTIFHISESDKNIPDLLNKINSISLRNINSAGYSARFRRGSTNLISKLICHDNLQLLEAMSKKDATFSSEHLNRAVRCRALKSVKFLMDNGVRANENNYDIVQNAIVYGQDIPLASFLLSYEKDLSGSNNTQILIEQAINLKESQDKKEFISYLLSKKIDIKNPQDNNESSALYEAIVRKDYTTTKLLLDRGANPNQRYKHGKTPLYEAIYQSTKEIVRLLLENKADVSLRLTDNEETVLDHAIKSKKIEIIRLLLEFTDNINSNTLTMVMKTGDDKIISLFDNLNVKGRPSKEEIANLFTEACSSRSTKAIDVLLKKGYDINSSSSIVTGPCRGYRKDGKMLEYVLSKGADVNLFSKDSHGKNVLHEILTHASVELTENQWEKLKLTLKYGVNVNQQDTSKRTPLMWALSFGRNNTEVVEYLLDNTDVDMTLLDENNQSLLHYVVHSPSVVKKIIEKLKVKKIFEQVVNTKDIDGETPLHYASSRSIQVVKLLLEAGAKTNIVNSNGFTPLAYIKDIESYGLLKNTGNDISKKKAKCKIYVDIMGQKDYQALCLDVAKHGTDINSITRHQLLGGDIAGLINTTFDKKQGVGRYLDALVNVGHGLAIEKDLEQAKVKYAMYVYFSYAVRGKSREEVDELIQADFDILTKLYGDNISKDAQTVWESILKIKDLGQIVYKELQ